MTAIELGKFRAGEADILIGRLQTAGIGAFPLTCTRGPQGGWTGILIDEADLDAARAIVTENLSED